MWIKIIMAWSLGILCCAHASLWAQTKPRESGLKASMMRGKRVYEQYCLTCHQADGMGVPSLNPPLSGTSYVLGDKDKLIEIVLKGFNENVPIEGDYYSNAMPPHGFLKDQEIADVLTFVRNSFHNKASAVSIGEVKAVRAKIK